MEWVEWAILAYSVIHRETNEDVLTRSRAQERETKFTLSRCAVQPNMQKN